MTEQMTELMGLVEVEKVSMSRDRSSIRISVVSPRLIHRKNIMDLERGIRDQLFPGKRLQVRIFEKYRLSGQYTPEKLLGAYRDSLLTELKNYSIVEYTMFRKARFSFPQPDLMHMTVEDTMVNKEKAGELKRILEKVSMSGAACRWRLSLIMWSRFGPGLPWKGRCMRSRKPEG